MVNDTVGAITYADYSRIGTLGSGNILVGDTWVPVSAAGAAIAVDASPLVSGRHQFDMAIALDRNTTAAGAYPLVLVSYAVVCLSYQSALDTSFVQQFLGWVASEQGQDLANTTAGSSPISADLRAQIMDSLSAITTANQI